MSETYNIWLGVSQQARDEFKAVRASLQEGADPYDGPMDEQTFTTLNRIHGLDHIERLFKPVSLGGKVWGIYSIYSPRGATAATIKVKLDYLEDQWPGHFDVIGVWHQDGRQKGQEWELDAEGERTGETTGTPVYAIPTAQLLKFMPDIVTPGADPENDPPIITPATELTDVHLIMGQAPRRFV